MTANRDDSRRSAGLLPLGELLAQLRLSRTVVVRRERYPRPISVPLSQRELGLRAGVVAAHICRIEAGTVHPTHAVTERIADALGLDELDRARLLVAAGYWPWPEADPDELELAISTVAAIVDGDYRLLSQDR